MAGLTRMCSDRKIESGVSAGLPFGGRYRRSIFTVCKVGYLDESACTLDTERHEYRVLLRTKWRDSSKGIHSAGFFATSVACRCNSVR
jgi:hypothetical protein